MILTFPRYRLDPVIMIISKPASPRVILQSPAMEPTPIAGPSKAPKRTAPPQSSSNPSTRLKTSKPVTSPNLTIPAEVVKGRSATLTTSSIPPPVRDTRSAQYDAKPILDEREEEWAEVMRRSHSGKKGADWYSKGVKTVQVGLLI